MSMIFQFLLTWSNRKDKHRIVNPFYFYMATSHQQSIHDFCMYCENQLYDCSCVTEMMTDDKVKQKDNIDIIIEHDLLTTRLRDCYNRIPAYWRLLRLRIGDTRMTRKVHFFTRFNISTHESYDDVDFGDDTIEYNLLLQQHMRRMKDAVQYQYISMYLKEKHPFNPIITNVLSAEEVRQYWRNGMIPITSEEALRRMESQDKNFIYYVDETKVEPAHDYEYVTLKSCVIIPNTWRDFLDLYITYL